MICSGANGLGLALVIPATQSLIADLYPPEARGRAFGLLLLFSGIGARPRARTRARRLKGSVSCITDWCALCLCPAVMDGCKKRSAAQCMPCCDALSVVS